MSPKIRITRSLQRLARSSRRLATRARSVPVRVPSANKWSMEYVNDYGISVAQVPLTFKEFFGIEHPTEYGIGLVEDAKSRVCNDVKTCENIGAFVDDSRLDNILSMSEIDLPPLLRTLYKDLDIIHNYFPNIEANVDMFVRDTLILLGFDRIHPHMCIVPSVPLKLSVSGKDIDVRPDIVLDIKTSDTMRNILLVHEDKKGTSTPTPHLAFPQLVAETLAAFRQNKQYRSIDRQLIYGITVIGTIPTFYKMEVNDSMLDTVRKGITKDKNTHVIQWCSPVMGQTALSTTNAVSVATNTERLKMYLKSYEAMRRLVSNEVDNTLLHTLTRYPN